MFNWPNLLTLSRVLAVPVFVGFYLAPSPTNHAVALAVFAAAAATDALDGFLARRLHRVTDLGKFLDPLADKVLVVSAWVCFVRIGVVPLWMVLVIVGRELVIMGFRALAAYRGIIIYPTALAKWKTAFQMTAVVLILGRSVAAYWSPGGVASPWDRIADGAITGVLWTAVTLTALTGVRYLFKNRQVVAGIFVR